MEQIPQGTNESFFAKRYIAQDFETPYHFHPEIELVYIKAGVGTWVIGDIPGSFHPGKVCLFGSHLPHLFHADHSSPVPESLVVQFSPTLLQSLVDLPEMIAVRKLIEASSQGLFFRGIDESWMEKSIQQLIQERGPERIVLFLDLISKLALWKDREPIASMGFQMDEDAKQKGRIKKAWKLLMESYHDEDIRQSDLAREFHMSVSAFSRFFRRATNLSFTEALVQVRLGHACRMLLEDDKGVAEICHASGFKNLSNFNRLFKKRYDCTPREWRLLVSKGADNLNRR